MQTHLNDDLIESFVSSVTLKCAITHPSMVINYWFNVTLLPTVNVIEAFRTIALAFKLTLEVSFENISVLEALSNEWYKENDVTNIDMQNNFQIAMLVSIFFKNRYTGAIGRYY